MHVTKYFGALFYSSLFCFMYLSFYKKYEKILFSHFILWNRWIHFHFISNNKRMDAIAEEYVKLVLAVGVHDGDYVDAYH